MKKFLIAGLLIVGTAYSFEECVDETLASKLTASLIGSPDTVFETLP